MASKTYTMTKCTWCAQNLPRVSIFDQNKRRVRLRLFSRPPRYLCQGREMCFSDSKSYISCQVHIVYHWSTPHPPKDSRCQIIIIDGIIPFIIIIIIRIIIIIITMIINVCDPTCRNVRHTSPPALFGRRCDRKSCALSRKCNCLAPPAND